MQRLALDALLPRIEVSSSSSSSSSSKVEQTEEINGEERKVDNEGEVEIVDEQDDNDDVILHAHTGSGKTLAYLLPTLCNVDPSRQVLQAVIIVPTRELGLQVVKIARRLAGGGDSGSGMEAREEEEDGEDDLNNGDNDEEEGMNASSIIATSTTTTSARRKKIIIMPILQGSTNARVRGWAKSEPPHIVVGTPEEICGLLSRIVRGNNDDFVNSVSTVVVDEVDACLSSGRGGGGSGSGQQGGALHEVLSKYLSPTSVDHRDESYDTILDLSLIHI